MNINDLKIGNIISYQANNNYVYSKYKIKDITYNKLQIVSVGTMQDYCLPIWIRKEQVISKFQPIIKEYEEIPIEKEAGPKSYKSEIRIISYSQNFPRWGQRPEVVVNGYIMDGANNQYFESTNFPFPENINLYKTYTIEIKEKE